MKNKIERLVITSDMITEKPCIGIWKTRENGIMEMECSRDLTDNELFRYLEIFINYLLNQNKSYFINRRDGIRYDFSKSEIGGVIE